MSADADRGADHDDVLVVERHGHVVVARLNRPEARNALSPGLIRALGAALVTAETDPEVRAMVLTGTGDRAFCAGMDLRAFAGGQFAIEDGPELQAFQRLTRGEIEVPLVGAANASAVAGGLELLLGCDLIVVAEGATLGLPEVKRGLFAGGGGTFIGARVPLGVALELTLTGDPIDADRALALGLANAVVPAADVLPVALRYAERIAANGPLAVRNIKASVMAALELREEDAFQRELELGMQVMASKDAKEGPRAFLEKRAPNFTGE